MPELALSELELTAALGAGELSLHAASSSEWGPALRLAVEVDRVAPFALLQDVCDATAVGDLALPPEILAPAVTDIEGVIDVPRRELSLAATPRASSASRSSCARWPRPGASRSA